MQYKINKIISSEKGFILITALIACVILLALTVLMINISTQDLRISGQSVGSKKAMIGAEAGIHRLMQVFTSTDKADLEYLYNNYKGIQVDPLNDPATTFSIAKRTTKKVTPAYISLPGYSDTDGGWVNNIYDFEVTGRSATYNTAITIAAGIGYGPVRPDPEYQ